jgi:two-component system cell cycle response regulator
MSTTKRILIVEDDTKVAKVMAIRLKSAGYEVLTAEDGVRGLQLAEKEKPDLIITDIWMPAGVGFAMVYRLKEMASEIPIIFMSASKDPRLRKHAVNSGAVAFLEKPYTSKTLLELVACAFNKPPSIKPPAPAATEAPAAGAQPRTEVKKVLIVEDDRKIALALATRLKGAGYEASIAVDAITGVNLAVKLQPDLIILDISMPAGSGFDVAERVQSLVPKLMPIIFLTASKQAGLRGRAMDLGAAGFFEKPYKGEELLAAVHAALGEPASLFAESILAKN